MTADEEARIHMERNPDHEVTVDTNDQWVCITCQEGEHDE